MVMRLGRNRQLPAALLWVALLWSGAGVNLLSQATDAARHETNLKGRAYEVVSIRPTSPGELHVDWKPLPNGFDIKNLPLAPLIYQAYGIHFDNQISGLPEWAKNDRFDVSARADLETVEGWTKLSAEDREKQKQLMLQTLFADRCQLKVRREVKQLPVYDLVIAKGGLKLKEVASNEKEAYRWSSAGSVITITDRAGNIGALGQTLSSHAGRLVIDKTGLGDRKFDIELRYSTNEVTTPGAADEAPSIFKALEELGLKLEAAKEPVETFVVDRIEKPSVN